MKEITVVFNRLYLILNAAYSSVLNDTQEELTDSEKEKWKRCACLHTATALTLQPGSSSSTIQTSCTKSHRFYHVAFIQWLPVTGKYTVLLHEYLSGLEVTANSLPPECVAEKMFISCSSTSILKTLEAYMCMICSQYGHSQSPFSWFVNFKTMKIYGKILLRPTTWTSLILTFSPWYLKHSVKCRKTFYLT